MEMDEAARRKAQIADLALSSHSQLTFREGVLNLLRDWIGFDGGFIHLLRPGEPTQRGTFAGIDMPVFEQSIAGWWSGYAKEIEPVAIASLRNRGAETDSHVFTEYQKSRMSFYADIFRPLRIRDAMFCHVGRTLIDGPLMGLVRNSRMARQFSDNAVDLVRDLLPLVRVADGLMGRPTPGARASVPLAKLTRREHEVVELVLLGYTNPEIGLALGTSANTVRNQLIQVFRKTGASTRAELVALILSRR
jgi:DNA-binding CsgD family transcriptional regulator